jgi:hypothetical protein
MYNKLSNKQDGLSSSNKSYFHKGQGSPNELFKTYQPIEFIELLNYLNVFVKLFMTLKTCLYMYTWVDMKWHVLYNNDVMCIKLKQIIKTHIKITFFQTKYQKKTLEER